MSEFIKELIVSLFGNYSWIGIIILAMIPVTELRVALPFAMSSAWGLNKLSWWQAYICAVVGSTIPALIIVPLLLPVFTWLKKTKLFGRIVNAFDKRFNNKSKNIDSKAKSEKDLRKVENIKFWGVVTFVAIPLPLTGAWTGSAVAAYIKMHWLKGVLAVFIGNLISGLIMLAICMLFPNATDYIMYAFLAIVVVVLLIGLITHFIKNQKKDCQEQEQLIVSQNENQPQSNQDLSTPLFDKREDKN
ncbi:MAG: small multi-drug export protein [Clostridia bacterium]|nr:small multi-drug export protein [Clostridia bacterium]